jgi:hypothetical protein
MVIVIGKVILGGISKYVSTMYTDMPVIKVQEINDIVIELFWK